eukprot:1161819-Pelagomonas_calceolata.AAC.6
MVDPAIWHSILQGGAHLAYSENRQWFGSWEGAGCRWAAPGYHCRGHVLVAAACLASMACACV